ncbi:MAG: protein-L-isoaspartate(D-aspartate) O-methyltransferase [Caldilineaceae bacterium]
MDCDANHDEGPPYEPPFPRPGGWREISNARVRRAFACVDRRLFVPPEQRQYANRDEPLPIGEGQTVSQPYVVALTLQALDLQPGDRVLEVGAGSGYQTALLCELVWPGTGPPGATVFALERSVTLMQRAAGVLDQAGYHPHLLAGDGALGWEAEAPFAGIVVSAAATVVPRPLVSQLADGGRMVIPVGRTESDQELWLVRRRHNRLDWHDLGPVRFVPLISPVLDDPWQQVIPPPLPAR